MTDQILSQSGWCHIFNKLEYENVTSMLGFSYVHSLALLKTKQPSVPYSEALRFAIIEPTQSFKTIEFPSFSRRCGK